jgi:biotin transport system substrate-specific component
MAYAQTLPMPHGVFYDAVAGRDSVLGDVAAVVIMSWAIAICARLCLPLPFSPVPLTGSTLGVLYAGALLGPRRGSAAAALYLLQGGCGLPFFAGGAAGWACLLGPTGGYLLGFLPGAWLAGWLAARGWDRKTGSSLALLLAGSAVILACGLVGLARFLPANRLLSAGFYPFLAGDLLKSAVCAALLPWGWGRLGSKGGQGLTE